MLSTSQAKENKWTYYAGNSSENAVYTLFYIRTSNFAAEAEPKLNVLFFSRFEPEMFLACDDASVDVTITSGSETAAILDPPSWNS